MLNVKDDSHGRNKILFFKIIITMIRINSCLFVILMYYLSSNFIHYFLFYSMNQCRKGRCVLVILASQWDPIAVPALSVQRAIFLVLEILIQDPRNQVQIHHY